MSKKIEKALVDATIERIRTNLQKGSIINPCGYNEKEVGYIIAEQSNHESFVNFPNLMNDEEFVLQIAQTSINPLECKNYFYDYINPYLTKSKRFKYKFLTALLLNDNIYKVDDLFIIVDSLGLEKQLEKAIDDEELMQIIQNRLNNARLSDISKLDLVYENKKECKLVKCARNRLIMQNRSKIIGLCRILQLFTCLTEEEFLRTGKTINKFSN